MTIANWFAVLALMASSAADVSLDQASVEQADRLSQSPELALPRALVGLQEKTRLNDQLWGLGSAKWSVDLDRGVIEFQTEKGWLVSAPVEVIGTYDTRDGTFMWGWDHPSVPAHSAKAATMVLEYGKRHGIKQMKTRLVSMTQDEVWQYTALADYLSRGNGAYRGPVGTTLVYMTFGEVTITKE